MKQTESRSNGSTWLHDLILPVKNPVKHLITEVLAKMAEGF